MRRLIFRCNANHGVKAESFNLISLVEANRTEPDEASHRHQSGQQLMLELIY